jgi:hypothetical protein
MIWVSLTLVLVFVACFSYGVVGKGASYKCSRWLHVLGAVLFIGAIVNFLIYWHVAVAIGGDALAGRATDGRYYLSSHGRRTEVSESLYRYSYAHTISTWITQPLGLLGWFLMYRADRIERYPPKRPLDDLDA